MNGATVIKADQTSYAGEQVSRLGLRSFQINDVLREAMQTVAAAREESSRLTEEARRQAEALRQQARKEGYASGLTQGRKEGAEVGRKQAFEAARKEFAEQQASLVAACRQAIDEINARRADWWAAARQDLVDLALAIGRRVARSVGQRERDTVLGNLEEAVKLAGRRSEVTVQVNPADAETARAFAEELMSCHEHWKLVPVVENAEISAGGCTVQWTSGSVDATLETQLDRIELELSGR
ncbi:MAG TPA: FliH/SctL family protein [Phycisphaerae bacterium]|nr:FliH/SctL family protein [Phycisphaerae bacterium]